MALEKGEATVLRAATVGQSRLFREEVRARQKSRTAAGEGVSTVRTQISPGVRSLPNTLAGGAKKWKPTTLNGRWSPNT